jgi:hypothetical protein
MRVATGGIRILIRIIGVVMITLGLSFWTGNALQLIPVHMLIGLLLVLLLWTQAILAAFARVDLRLVGLALAWGLVVPILGMTQTSLLPGDLHWLVQVVHLLVGLAAIGLAETLARRMGATMRPARARTAQVEPSVSA